MSAPEVDGRHTEAATHTRHAGSSGRFGRRWRLVGAGLCNVWRFGDLDLPAPTGRLLLRGPNGTGKTTALEGLWPYLLDMNPQRLSAGKARPTSLSSLMREGASKRRCGYTWMTLAAPGNTVWTFGARLQYSEGASPPVKRELRRIARTAETPRFHARIGHRCTCAADRATGPAPTAPSSMTSGCRQWLAGAPAR